MEWIYEGMLYIAMLFLVAWVHAQNKKGKRKERRERQLEKEISRLSCAYRKYHNVEDALADSKMPAEDVESLKIGKWDKGQKLQEKQNPEKSVYELLLQKLCGMVLESGDRKKDGDSVFLRNLMAILDEVRDNGLLFQKTYYAFLGLRPLCVLPFFFVPLIRLWAVKSSDQLLLYYQGSFEIITITITFVVTIISYLGVAWLENQNLLEQYSYRMERQLLKKRYVKQRINRKIQRRYAYYLKKNEYLKGIQGFGNVREFEVRKRITALLFLIGALFVVLLWFHSNSRMDKQLVFPRMYTLALEEEEVKQLEEEMREQFQALMRGDITLQCVEEYYKAYPNEIRQTALLLLKQAYEKEKVHGRRWYLFGVPFLLGVAGFFLPEFLLRMEEGRMTEKKMEEVQILLIVLFVQIQDAQVTMEQLLDALEEHAVVFKRAIEEAVDHFSMDWKKSMHECDSMYLRMEQVEKESVIQKEDGAVLQGWLENE